ncbi:glycosyltransferase family 4 protein [Candidatus Woesebacteria bacterium]|nr:glycosyltransferase family 4 protein [Candidatus Woesebacteria bacterium]
MRAAIYNPYLDTMGGGERYSLAFATVLKELGFRVDVEWKSKNIKGKLEDRFGIDLTGVNFVKDIKRGDGYEVCFWVSDGSIPTLRSRKNFLHFQVPFHDVNGKTLLNRMKLFRIGKAICNSYFTKTFIDKEYGVKSIVIYPPVDVTKIKPKRKENIILYVGRFSTLVQSKRQDILIGAFKRFSQEFGDWKLVLAGGIEIGKDESLDRLEKASLGYPIEIVKSPSFKEIKKLYGQAKFFWSAAGFGVNEKKEPEKVEHFGMTTVEAMAAKAVPFVFSAGGAREIIKDSENGYLWRTTAGLLNNTKELITAKGLVKKLSEKAHHSAQYYSYERFKREITGLL